MSSSTGILLHIPKELVGITGRLYCFKKLLQHRPPLGSVWTATHGQQTFVLKNIPENIYYNFMVRLLPQLRTDPSVRVRLPIDTIPDRRICVYQHMSDDFLHLVRKKISMRARWQILKASLQAIADLHDRDVVHLDVKPDNIMVDLKTYTTETVVEDVKIIDLENAAFLPRGKCVKGMPAGNENWRSIEGHFKGELGRPSDMFSFGLVCLYAMYDRVICGPDEDFKKHESQGALPVTIRLQRLVSYFGEEDGVNGLMKHVRDDELSCQVLSMLWEGRSEECIPYKPFWEWPEAKHDETFGSLIRGLMNLDPNRRITAAQALHHPWLADQFN